MRNILFIFPFFFLAKISSGQQILLLTEDFEGGNNIFTDTSQFGGATGTNIWTINDSYDGMGIYPNTTNQDSTITGTITNSPFSTYLHIHDSTSVNSGVSNANYDPVVPSDRFIHMLEGFCTLGMTDINFTFFYLSEGAADAYGEVYYSIDGGPWTKTGANAYRNQTRWKYETITDPAFADVPSLRFGFKWVNGAGSLPGKISFAIDDIIVVGTYDNVNSPTTITINQLFPDPVCQLNNLIMEWILSSPLCDGSYRVQLSNANGNFNNPTSLGVFNITDLQTNGFIAATIPATTPPGACYKVRINRIAPAPVITGIASVCFEIEACPNIITTMTPLVTTDADTVCSKSVIDIPFTSTGVYNSNNIYTAQLSDSTGSFDTPLFIGSLPSSETFDPAIGAMPGSVSGLIPEVPAGCNYFIRIISSSPSATGSIYGPFCIKQCDITTNNTQDIHVCISETAGVDTTLDIDIHEWNNLAQYFNGNSFQVQLLETMFFTVVNTGGLGVTFDTASTTMTLSIPGLNTLLTLGIIPGVYYMRIIADSSSIPNNVLGTLVRLTIGAPADIPPLIIPDQSSYCNTEVASFLINPANPDSDYEWLSPSLNNGNPFIWEPNPLLVDFSGAAVDFYTFYVTEINFGCAGDISRPVTVPVTTNPNLNIIGSPLACVGDTFHYEVLFLPGTYYEWTLNGGTIVDTSNNEINVVFDSEGFAELNVYALNICGVDTNSFNIEVVSVLDLNLETLDSVDIGPSVSICKGEKLDFVAARAGRSNLLKSTLAGGSGGAGNMFDIKANVDLVVNQIDGNLKPVPTDLEIYFKQGSYVGFERDPSAWTLLGSTTGLMPNSNGTATPIPIPINMAMSAGDTLAFYITTTNGTTMSYTVGTNAGALYRTDGYLEFYQGSGNFPSFGPSAAPRIWNGNIHYFTQAGISYLWSTGDTTEVINVAPEVNTLYSVQVSDTTGCGNSDKVSVIILPDPPANAGNDTSVCIGGRFKLNATGGDEYLWESDPFLSNTGIPDPEVIPQNADTFIVKVTDTVTGCIAYDTVAVEVFLGDNISSKVQICNSEGAIELAVNDLARYEWSTGDTSRSIKVMDAGVYTAIVSGGMLECTKQYSFEVLDDKEVNQDTLKVCQVPEPVMLTISETSDSSVYEWNTGDTTPSIEVNTTGRYTALVAQGTLQCKQYIFDVVEDDCEIKLIIPTAFAPGSQENPRFTVFATGPVTEYEIKIYNRWGEMVYQNKDGINDLGFIKSDRLSKGWDGVYKGNSQDLGTYVYFIIAGNPALGQTFQKEGSFVLVR